MSQSHRREFFSSPKTRILAIGSFLSFPTRDRLKDLMAREAAETVTLYLEGKIDPWYARQDEHGVVFVLDVVSVEEAYHLLEKLPLAGLMNFDLIPLGPLKPLRYLLPAIA